MMTKEESVNIRRLIEKGEIKEALRLTIEKTEGTAHADTAVSLSGQYHEAKMNQGTGDWSTEQVNQIFARVRNGLLSLLNTSQSQTPNPDSLTPTFLTNTRRAPLAKHLVLGRENDLDDIDEKFAKGDYLLVLTGMGGVGKSTLAGYYMEKRSHAYRHIAWVHYTGDFKADCARELNDYAAMQIPAEHWEALSNMPSGKLFGELMKYLAKLPCPNLLVVDNLNTLDDAEDAAEHTRQLPNGWKILVTAREHNEAMPHHAVGVLKPEEARDLFMRHYAPDSPIPESLSELLEYVGHHTLVVEFLAKTTKRQGWLPKKMLDRLKEQGLTRLETKVEVPTAHAKKQRNRMADYIADLFDINLGKLSEAERWLLANLSVLPAFPHAFSVLVEMFAKKEGMAEDSLFPLLNDLCLRGFLEELPARRPTHLNLEGQAEEERGFYMHPVMQEVVREKIRPVMDGLREVVEYFIDKYFYEDGNRNPAYAFSWLPYGEVILRYLLEHEDTGTLANNLSLIYKSQGDLKSALEWQQKAIEILEKALPGGHPDLANSYNNLSLIYHDQDELESALEWQQKAIEIWGKALPEDHPLFANAYNNLSLIYKSQDELRLALEWQQKAIEILEKTMPEDHPYFANSYNNLSLIYKLQGELLLALEWQQKAIEIWEKTLPADHPHLGTAYSNLSLIFKSQGDLSTALEWQQKAIALKEKALGKNHPDLAISLLNLAGIYDEVDESNTALPHIERAVAIFQNCFPEGHSDLDIALGWLERIQKRAKE